MKIILNAPSIAKLVELDPIGTLEMAKGAAEQVATALAKKVTRKAFDAHVASFMEGEMTDGNWYQKKIAEPLRKLLFDTMQSMAQQFVSNVTMGHINVAIRQRVDEVLAEKMPEIDAMLIERADRLLKERFAVMFSGKA